MAPTMNIRAAVSLVGVAAVVMLGWWLQEQITRPPQPAASRAERAPDYYLDDFTLIDMNRQGQPRSRLSAERMTHYAYDDHAELTQPRLLFYPHGGAPWHVRAERGRVSDNNKLVDLLGPVHIERPASTDNRPVTVDTRDLAVYPADSYATSKAHTVIRSQASMLEGVGMRVWFTQQRLELLSQVRGSYRHATP
ncbi:MAG: LPS export ABC transporter periplasmic protein LptC [Gammaproteobacteria bacterium]